MTKVEPVDYIEKIWQILNNIEDGDYRSINKKMRANCIFENMPEKHRNLKKDIGGKNER
tara:strand:- start:6354 stop:6530 length:177 start_codon:yes stop_codon:yes gene_type:complete